MRIGIDAHVLGKNIGGVERYVEHLVRRLPEISPQHDFYVFLSRSAYAKRPAEPPSNVQYVRLPASDPLLERTLVLPWMMRRHRLDVIQVQRIAPWLRGRCRVLLTIHDLIPLKYPSRYRSLRNRLIRMLTADSVHRAAMILTPTQAVAGDITQHFPRVTAPIRAFYNGVDLRQFSSAVSGTENATLTDLGLQRPFLLTVGALEARKNLEVQIEALSRLQKAAAPMLAVVGSSRDPHYREQMQALARRKGVAERIRWLGFVPHGQLTDLYRSATLFITSSWDEGFNIPPLEAMASGTPVLCSDIPVHRELFEGATDFFRADSADDLVSAVTDALTGKSPRDTRAASASDCVEHFSWEAMAHRMARFIDELEVAPTP